MSWSELASGFELASGMAHEVALVPEAGQEFAQQMVVAKSVVVKEAVSMVTVAVKAKIASQLR